jgi:hypothetical protein
MKLKTRILWLCAATLLGLVVLSAVALTTLYQSMMKERTAQLSNLVVLAHAAAQKAHDKEKSGALSREGAIKEATLTIGSFVDKDKYFFVRGYSNDVNYVHPNPKRIGIVDEKGGKEAGVRYRAALQASPLAPSRPRAPAPAPRSRSTSSTPSSSSSPGTGSLVLATMWTTSKTPSGATRPSSCPSARC